jgi:hypothetical protein
MYKIIGADGKEYGPISADQLRQWISQGRAHSATQVRLEGDSEWKKLSDFPELSLAASVAPAPLPFAATGQGAPAATSRTSALAITSLVLGLLGLFTCGITALVGLIFGIVAVVKIKRSDGRVTGSGLAIAGICVSAVFLMMMPLFAALMLPALAKAKQKAMTINCENNLRQLGLGVIMYAGSNNDQFPPAAGWSDAISTYVGSTNAFKCPSDPGKRCSYAFNQALDGKKLSAVNPRTVLLFESDAGWNGAGGAEAAASHGHHTTYVPEEMINIVHVDGSAESVPVSRLAALRWNP